MRGQQAQAKDAVESIDASLLPRLSQLLDDAIDSAALARPGIDADLYATELRYVAGQLDALAALVAGAAALAQAEEPSLRMSA